MDVSIRPATESDLNNLLALLPQLTSRSTSAAAQMPTLERAGEILRQLLAREDVTVLVAVDAAEGAVVGTLTLVLVPNLTYAGRPWNMIENIVVDQPWRGREIGRQLMQHAMALAEQRGCYKVQLLSGRKPEQVAFYAELGFDSSGCRGHKLYLGRNPAA